MELKRRDMCCKQMIESGHVDVKVKLCGLYVDKCDVYLNGRPDLLTSCECHAL